LGRNVANGVDFTGPGTPSSIPEWGADDEREVAKRGAIGPQPTRKGCGLHFQECKCYSSQFSNLSPGTFSKSRRLALRNRALFAMAMQAVFRSMVAIFTPDLRKLLKSPAAVDSSKAIV